MNNDAQLKLQAFLDNELSERDSKEVAAWLAQDQEATLLLAELRNTRQALTGFENGVRLPESREFFWSKIERQIQREIPAETAKPRKSRLATWSKFLVPTGAVAALAIVLLVAIAPNSKGPEVESADPGAFTYRDFSSGTTLVWLSYPAENELAQNESATTLH